jgi:hypothetical protein
MSMIQFMKYPNSQPGIIGSCNKGLYSVYMRFVDSGISDPGTGNGWFKSVKKVVAIPHPSGALID